MDADFLWAAMSRVVPIPNHFSGAEMMRFCWIRFLLQVRRELKGLRAQHERLSEALSARNEELAGLRGRLDAAAPPQKQGEDEDEAWLVQGTAWDR